MEESASVIHELKVKHDIRHSLALDRTILANERTLLAYARTSLTLLVPGASFLYFTDSLILWVLGWIFVPLGVFSFIYGWKRFTKKKETIKEERKMLDEMLRNEYCRI